MGSPVDWLCLYGFAVVGSVCHGLAVAKGMMRNGLHHHPCEMVLRAFLLCLFAGSWGRVLMLTAKHVQCHL